MRALSTLIMAISLVACSKSYNELDSMYGQDQVSDTKPIPTKSIDIMSRQHVGVTNIRGTAKVRLPAGRIEITTGIPFARSLSIPSSDIKYCGMTCFGKGDSRVDLLIPKSGTTITIQNKNEMLDWCWQNKKAIISGEDQRNWEYKHLPLPPQIKYTAQLNSRNSFDEQALQSCMGY